jgi:hypothetical protein
MSGSELRPVARELVDSARIAQTPSDAQRERAFEALLAGLSSAAGGGSLGAANAAKIATKSGLTGLKWALLAAALASASVGVYVHLKRPRAAPAAATLTAAAPPVSVTLPTIASSDPTAVLPTTSASSEVTATPPAKVELGVKPASGDLEQELALLHQALAESRSGNAAGALALAQQHARQYPNSKLRVERDAIEVRSLCTLGRAAEAHKIADRLRTQAPGSPVSAALEETCVGK